MPNSTIKRQEFGIGPFILFLVAGLSFTWAGLFFVKDIKVNPSWTKISAEVIDLVRTRNNLYQPVYQYSVNGQNYQVASEISSSRHPAVGDKGEIAYDPNHPDQAKVVEGVGGWFFTLVFPMLGMAVLIMAPIFFIKSLKRSTLIKRLLQMNQKIQGILTDVQSVGGSNRKANYKVTVSATDPTGIVRNYISDTIGNVGGLTLVDFRSNPIPVAVYIDAAHPELYYVDVSDLPNLTPQEINELLVRQIKK